MPTPVDVDTTERSIDSVSREERVSRRAQEFYRLRGDRPGSALEDWLRAEEEIREAEEQAVDVASERFFSGERFARALEAAVLPATVLRGEVKPSWRDLLYERRYGASDHTRPRS